MKKEETANKKQEAAPKANTDSLNKRPNADKSQKNNANKKQVNGEDESTKMESPYIAKLYNSKGNDQKKK